jgi:hypothetical protein
MKGIILMAREAGFMVGPARAGSDDMWGLSANLVRFADLIRADEREVCWRVAENYDTGYEAAEAIRARGTT